MPLRSGPVFLSYNKSLLPLSKTLSDIGMSCDEEQTKAGNPSSFYTSRMRPRDAFKSLMAFWTAKVPVESVSGLLGRAFGEGISGRKRMFCQCLV